MSHDKDSEITWESPPPDTRKPHKPSKWDPIATALKANPGKWARVVTQGNISVAGAAAKGGLKCFRPAGSFESRVTSFATRFTGDVYLRYIGEHGEFKDIA